MACAAITPRGLDAVAHSSPRASMEYEENPRELGMGEGMEMSQVWIKEQNK